MNAMAGIYAFKDLSNAKIFNINICLIFILFQIVDPTRFKTGKISEKIIDFCSKQRDDKRPTIRVNTSDVIEFLFKTQTKNFTKMYQLREKKQNSHIHKIQTKLDGYYIEMESKSVKNLFNIFLKIIKPKSCELIFFNVMNKHYKFIE